MESIRQKLNASDNTLQLMVITLHSYICEEVIFRGRCGCGSSNMVIVLFRTRGKMMSKLTSTGL